MQDKQCNICKRWYPPTTEHFNTKLTSTDGLTKACSRCCIKANGNSPPKPYAPNRTSQSTPVRLPKMRINERGESERRCGHCKLWFLADLEHFYRNANDPSGLSNDCRVCTSEAVASSWRKPSAYKDQRREKRRTEANERRQVREIASALKREQREQEHQLEIEARHAQALVAEGFCRCTTCKEIYPLDWAHFGTKRRTDELSRRCFICRNPDQYGGYDGALAQLQIRKNPVLWQVQETRRKERERAQDREKEKKCRRSPKGKRVTQVKTQQKRARKHALPETLTTEQWVACLDYFGYCCAVCGQPAGMFTTLAQDHWIPVAYKGADNPGTVLTNMIPLCHSTEAGMFGCNNRKGDRNAHDWLVSTYGARKAKQIEARINAYFDSVRPGTTSASLALPVRGLPYE